MFCPHGAGVDTGATYLFKPVLWRELKEGFDETAKVVATTTTASAATNTSHFGATVAAAGPFVFSLTHDDGVFVHYAPVPAVATRTSPQPLNAGDQVGAAVAAKGELVLAGAPGHDDGGGPTDDYGVVCVAVATACANAPSFDLGPPVPALTPSACGV